MFNIRYETWEKVVNTYFDIPTATLTSYLQWFPLTKQLTRRELLDKEYFDNYIEKGFFITNSETMLVQRNYMQKFNGQYRQSQLISPIIFLIIQSVCVQISEDIRVDRQEEISVFYSGDISNLNPLYKSEYSKFTKTIILEKENHDYFIKLDISNYFPSINIDKLFSLIEKNSPGMNQIDLLMYRELLKYIGNGKYPVIQNSVGTSYLATSIYLAEIDNKIFDHFENESLITNFKMFRYVDDLYILFNTKANELSLIKFYEEFLRYANTLFHLNDLDLNFEKTHFDKTDNISEYLSTLFYNEIVNGEEFDIYGLEVEQEEALLEDFLQAINQVALKSYILPNKTYMEIVNRVFLLEDKDLSAKELLNKIVYSKKIDFKKEEIRNNVVAATDFHVIRTAPKILFTLLLNTRDGDGIRSVLNNLLSKARAGDWILHDLELAITYLLKRSFSHKDLIDALIGQSPENEILNKYINHYCLGSSWSNIKHQENEKLIRFKITKLTNQLYFLYLVNKKRDDYLAAYSYYKSFFDRITAELAWVESGFRKKKPSYESYYRAKDLKKFYSDIPDSTAIIDKASDYRNFNPINHGLAQLISNTRISKADLSASLNDLRRLISTKIDNM